VFEVITVIRARYSNRPDFPKVERYVWGRYPALRGRYLNTQPYVRLHRENHATFSDEFAGILRDTGAVFGSAMDEMLRVAQQSPSGQTKWEHYSKFLLAEIPDLQRHSIHVRALHPSGLLLPFGDMTATSPPSWWTAHNKVKHVDAMEYRLGNLQHCLNAVGALALLGHLLGAVGADMLFMNVGIAYDDTAIDMRPDRRLFP
jgi:hypothetical protein